jgi:hypothetical protein
VYGQESGCPFALMVAPTRAYTSGALVRGTAEDMLETSIRWHDRPGALLVASCLGDEDTGGGLLFFDGTKLERVDALSSTGLACAGDHLFRMVRSTEEDCGELLVYDQVGIEYYRRLDALLDSHDVMWDGENLVAVSSLGNRILWLSPSGEVRRTWQAPGEGDAWHLNGLHEVGGRLFVSAFGKYSKHREWCDHQERPTGFVMDFQSGEEVLSGLSHPHHPRYFDARWAVCNSLKNEVLQVDPDNRSILRTLRLNGYTRGFAVADELLFIGESANRRGADQGQYASIAIISRHDWQIRGRVPLPCREVYDLLLVDDHRLLDGVRRGFRTNSRRVLEQDQHYLFQKAGVEPERLWAVSEPLPAKACRIRIDTTESGPLRIAAGQKCQVRCRIQNLGGAILHSVPPHPVHLSYKWFESGAWRSDLEGERTKLGRALPPGESRPVGVNVKAPPNPGRFVLRLTAVQEGVAWFDDIEPSNMLCLPAEVCEDAGSAPLLNHGTENQATLSTETS